MGSLQRCKRSDNKQRTVELRWGIFCENLTYILYLRAVTNIPIQTLIISPWLSFRKMIISQLELGPPLSHPVYLIVLPLWNRELLKTAAPLPPKPPAVSITELFQWDGKMFITAWLLDMIDSCLIEKLRMYSSVSHFLDLKGRHFCTCNILRLKGSSICRLHNQAQVEFIRNNKPVTTPLIDRSGHPVYLIILPLWNHKLLKTEVAVLVNEMGVLYR